MNQESLIKPIAYIHTDFPAKFGIPRQSGLADTSAKIVFDSEFRNPDALRGIEEYSHLWLLWKFSESVKEKWSPTVRPPRLGGNKRVGVFATRSPFRPNSIGLSCVKLESVKFHTEQGPVLYVRGADMMDGTPIYDIKPYLPYVDSYPEACGGFAERTKEYELKVTFSKEISEEIVPEDQKRILTQILSQDPRPSYQDDPERVYGMEYAGLEVKFRIIKDCLNVCEIVRTTKDRR